MKARGNRIEQLEASTVELEGRLAETTADLERYARTAVVLIPGRFSSSGAAGE